MSEMLREHQYAVSQEELRQYFPIDRVLAGMFQVVKHLFGVDVVSVTGWDVWHETVQCFEIRKDGELVGSFYLDPFAREQKRGGAWMADCRNRRGLADGVQLPVAFLVCNFTPPNEAGLALLTHDQVTTLFHKFKHKLHHILTQINQTNITSINDIP